MAQLELDTGGDYAPDRPGRKKVSRARKSLIGLLFVGAIAALANGGTFASFTASTDNASSGTDPFAAQNPLALGNTVVNGEQLNDVQCDSTATSVIGTNLVATVDANAVECDFLFDTAQVAQLASGETITSEIALENLSETATGDLSLFASDPCAEDAVELGGNLCPNLNITIQEVAVGGTPGGTATESLTDFSGLSDVNDCVLPDVGNACASASDTDLWNATADDIVGASNPWTVGTELAPDTDETNAGVRYFRITAGLRGSEESCVGDADGIIDDTGIGCSNNATGSARFTLRWVLTESS
jgi:hypothetical protein